MTSPGQLLTLAGATEQDAPMLRLCCLAFLVCLIAGCSQPRLADISLEEITLTPEQEAERERWWQENLDPMRRKGWRCWETESTEQCLVRTRRETRECYWLDPEEREACVRHVRAEVISQRAERVTIMLEATSRSLEEIAKIGADGQDLSYDPVSIEQAFEHAFRQIWQCFHYEIIQDCTKRRQKEIDAVRWVIRDRAETEQSASYQREGYQLSNGAHIAVLRKVRPPPPWVTIGPDRVNAGANTETCNDTTRLCFTYPATGDERHSR
jgi:hypothetical protein